MFYKNVRLKGPAGETLTVWLLEENAETGETIVLEQDSKRRPWLVEEASTQLVLASQIDKSVVMSVVPSNDSVPKSSLRSIPAIAAVPDAVLAKPRRTRGKAKLFNGAVDASV